MSDQLPRGTRVRTRSVDVVHHTRLPGYALGATGTVLGLRGRHPLADDVARGLPSTPSRVYAVSFDAAALFGVGEHTVVLDLWEQYLCPESPEREAS